MTVGPRETILAEARTYAFASAGKQAFRSDKPSVEKVFGRGVTATAARGFPYRTDNPKLFEHVKVTLDQLQLIWELST